MHIGLFDSGVGGLTVLKELLKTLPQARFTYLGDTARLPYGNKAPETIKKYVLENCQFLVDQGVDKIVIACHSASSISLSLENYRGVPVYNVIAPSCEQALKISSHKKIGIMATKATISSLVYPNHIMSLEPKAQVLGQSAPLLVPLVEEGLIDDPITEQVLGRYLKPLLDFDIDTLLLGCTHYPILSQAIAKICGDKVSLIDPAQTLALKLQDSSHTGEPNINVFLSDQAPHFITHARDLLGEKLSQSIQWHSLT